MSALTDLFSSMANKIRSKTGTATTYTPSEMASDGIDDVFDAGVASATTSITPSNSSPAAMTANTGYKPTKAGYAIESYNTVTPSDSNPPTLTSGTISKITTYNGYAIKSEPTDLLPSNNLPKTITTNVIYKASGNGVAIQNYTNITPSSSGTQFNSGFNKMSSGGYAYTERPTPSISGYTNPTSSISTASTTFSLSGMNGKKLLVFLFYQAGSATAYNRLDGATATGGTISKLCNLRNANGNAYGTFYNLSVTSNTCTITAPYSCFYQVFEAS